MKKKEQIINPLVRFRQKAQGRYANRISTGNHARGMGPDETRCFFIVSAQIGNPHPEYTTICFNKSPSQTGCGVVTVSAGFWFKVNGVEANDQSYFGPGSGDCLVYRSTHLVNGDQTSPQDTVTFDYNPGNCAEDGDAECALEALTNYPVDNQIWGPNRARVGDNDLDNIVSIYFPTDVQAIGANWRVQVNGANRGIIGFSSTGNRIDLTLNANVVNGDTVTYSHIDVANGARSVDGRDCWQFQEETVANSVGQDFRLLADGGFRLLGTGMDARILS